MSFNPLSSDTHNIQSLRLLLMNLVGIGPENNSSFRSRRFSDQEILQATYNYLEIGKTSHRSLQSLLKDVLNACFSFTEKDDVVIDKDGNEKVSESAYRRIITGITNKPWVFICNVAENSESSIYKDIVGKEYGFNENVTTWQGIVAAGSGSVVIFYNTYYNKINPMMYTAIARVKKVIDVTNDEISSLKEWRLILDDYEEIVPVSRDEIQILKRNSQNGIQAVTYETFELIAQLGYSNSYSKNVNSESIKNIEVLSGVSNVDVNYVDKQYDVTFLSKGTLKILSIASLAFDNLLFNANSASEYFLCTLTFASLMSLPGISKHEKFAAYKELRSVFPEWHSVDNVEFARMYLNMKREVDEKSNHWDETDAAAAFNIDTFKDQFADVFSRGTASYDETINVKFLSPDDENPLVL